MSPAKMLGVDLGSLDEALTGEQVTGEDLLVAGILLVIGLLFAWLIGRWRHSRLSKFDPHAQPFIGLATRVAQVLVIAVSVGWALTSLGADIGWLTVVLALTGFLVVLAARPILEGMGASAALVTRPAFAVGDEIGVDDVVGEVLEITNRSTVIQRRDGRRVHIPNVEMLSKTVTVYTVDQLRRSAVEVTVGFETDIDRVEELLRRELERLDEIDHVGSVRAQALTDGVQLSVRFWHPSGLKEGTDALDAAVRSIVTTLAGASIRFAPAPELSIVHSPDSSTTGDPATAREGQ
jgi:small-conductance mechanosensitive channel